MWKSEGITENVLVHLVLQKYSVRKNFLTIQAYEVLQKFSNCPHDFIRFKGFIADFFAFSEKNEYGRYTTKIFGTYLCRFLYLKVWVYLGGFGTFFCIEYVVS